MSTRTVVRALAATLIALGALAIAGPAGAHVTVSPKEVPAGGYATVYFQVPHGCEGEPTTSLSVKLRDDISSVKAEMVPGWTATYTKAALAEPVEIHGRPVTEYVDTITWTTDGEPLPDDQFMRFGVSMKVPDLSGEALMLPAVQTCPSGDQATWIDPDPESRNPAPMLMLATASGDGHGGGSGAPVETAEAEQAVTASSASDTASSPAALIVAIAALVVALGAAIVALTVRRRTA